LFEDATTRSLCIVVNGNLGAPAVKNPPWTRDELILALDLYVREPSARGSKTHPDVQKLSDLLNRLPIRPGAGIDANYRNPNGVGMKLSNFLRYDPDYEGKGLERGGKLEEEMWNEFADDRKRLAKVAAAIRSNYDTDEAEPLAAEAQEEDEEATEGRILTRVHRARERNSKLIQRKKDQVLKASDRLACEVCGFDFAETYGSVGEGFAECHHNKPVSELRPGEKTKLSDLSVLCANCHRMLHRAKPWLAVNELRERLQEH
jgi:5-methylcytosine-specific restriction protein A